MKLLLFISLVLLITVNTNFLSYLDDATSTKKHKHSPKPRKSGSPLPDVAVIAKNHGAGCGINDNDEIDCVFPNLASLEAGQNEIKAKGVEFSVVDTYGPVNVKYTAYDPATLVLRVCNTGVYAYALKKVEDKILILDDVNCRSNPEECIPKEEECDDSDCLDKVKFYFAKRINLELLNQYKELYPTAVAKANWQNILKALKDFKSVLELDALNPSCGLLTPARIFDHIVKKSANVKTSDTISNYTRAQIDQLLSSC